MVAAPLPERRTGSRNPLPLRLSFDGVTSAKRLSPVVHKSQKAERTRLPALRILAPTSLRSGEVHQLGLLGVEFKPVLGKPLRQCTHDPGRVIGALATDDKIVRVTDQHDLASTVSRDHLREPFIQHFVQIHIR